MEFTIEKAQSNPTKILTKTGKQVIVSAWNVGGPYPIIAIVKAPGEEPVSMAYSREGMASNGDPRLNLILDIEDKKDPVAAFKADFERIAEDCGIAALCKENGFANKLSDMENELAKKILPPTSKKQDGFKPQYSPRPEIYFNRGFILPHFVCIEGL